MKRVVVTGMGIISPLGNSIDTFWNNIKEQKTAIKPITHFDTEEYKVKLAAEVTDFDPTDYNGCESSLEEWNSFCQFAVAAAGQAIKDANLDLTKEDTTKNRCISRFWYWKSSSH